MHHLPSEEVCTLLRRSEVEHLVGQELIKSLANFKQMGSGSFILNQKTKNKSRTPVFKVVCDMLMKK
jgi:hypothetical protein